MNDRRLWALRVVAVAAASVLVVVISAGCGGGSDLTTHEGQVSAVNVSGVAIGLDLGDRKGTGFVVGDGTRWLGLDGSWRDSGAPECLPPLSRGARVSIDTINVDGGEVVVRVRCLSLPTEVYWDGEAGESPFTAYCAATAGKARPISQGNTDPC